MNKLLSSKIFSFALLPAMISVPVMPNIPSFEDILARAQNRIGSGYIVMLKGDVTSSEALSSQLSDRFKFTIEQVYDNALKGFSAKLSASTFKNLSEDPRVEAVVKDEPVEAFAQVLPTGVDRVDAEVNTNKGGGVAVAVLDSGVDTNHADLKGSVVAQKSCVFGKSNAQDDNGHGSHVAGIIAARNNTVGAVGVAPQVNLAAVKVLDRNGYGSWSTIICGLDWVAANAKFYNIKVANLSLGGSGSNDNNCGFTNNDPLHRAICRVRDAGVTVVVAAGNSNINTKSVVPAAYNDAVITVSALADSDGKAFGQGNATSYGADDTFASFSNFGVEVDLGAPGVSIYSTYKNGGYTTMSGTSMAAPHVAAAAALYIKSNPNSTWAQVRSALISQAEILGSGHTDPSGKHPEPVLKAGGL